MSLGLSLRYACEMSRLRRFLCLPAIPDAMPAERPTFMETGIPLLPFAIDANLNPMPDSDRLKAFENLGLERSLPTIWQ